MSVVGPVRYEFCPPEPIQWHECADVFPWIDGAGRSDLIEDIRQNGVVEPIVFLAGAILDGRNRYTVARELGIEYPRCDYIGDDPLGFVISKNLKRRHLTESQRAMVAAKLAKMPRGARTDIAPIGAKSDAQAAAMLNVGERSVERAKAVERTGAPGLVKAVEAGDVSLHAAADIAALPVERQVEIIRQADPKAFSAAVKEARAEKQAGKKLRRQEREQALAARIQALPEDKFGVIYADPEWKWEAYSDETGMDRAAANHYPVSDTDAIAGRDVASIAADDCVLFLWATAPMLPDALRVMEAWGFSYRTHSVWLKNRMGTGYWFRNMHEVLLVGVKGNIPAPAMGDQFPSVIAGDVTAHSAKPDVFLEMIESYYPTLPKIELNRRGPARDNWAAWGQEADQE